MMDRGGAALAVWPCPARRRQQLPPIEDGAGNAGGDAEAAGQVVNVGRRGAAHSVTARPTQHGVVHQGLGVAPAWAVIGCRPVLQQRYGWAQASAPGRTASGHRAGLHRGVGMDCDEHQRGRRQGKGANDRNGVMEATRGDDKWLEQAAIIVMDRGEKLNKQDI
ncbi:hypothetical protein GUJ93_ZPchr0006g43583 [Zizania palustris]|uniref:Uncharacterized protein n=1 Tax=Zizania palustris TaxID=103762 RepID=A0A8J5S7F9_ZIZPA|nr:hypothetical protein GUJ93_ZPchr0006g43583 [Zizania palustris]